MNRYSGWPFAKGSEENLLATTLCLFGAFMAHMALRRTLTKILLSVTSLVWLLVVYFFRDPERDHPREDEAIVLCPADGEVVEICTMYEETYLHRDVVRVSIFLSLFDVHVQRVPINGRVAMVEHVPGQFLQAFRPEASEVNEYIATKIDTVYGTILVKQIAGILARRCVNYLHVDQQVTAGERLGLIRFSSRVDIFLPTNVQLRVNIGDKVLGGITPIAQLI